MKKPIQKDRGPLNVPERKSRGRKREDASFPVAPLRMGLPDSYAAVLAEIKRRIQAERLRTVMAANSAMVMLYWDIGRLILERQEREGWGAKVIDRLSADLREAYPGHERPVAAQPQVHAGLCGGLAGPVNCATGCCTNSLVSHNLLLLDRFSG